MVKTLITQPNIEKLNKDIEQFDNVHKIEEDMSTDFKGVSKMIMYDRYSYKDTSLETLGEGDLVVLTVKPDPKYPQRGLGIVQEIKENQAEVYIYPEFQETVDEDRLENGVMTVYLDEIDKPLEHYYEQISKRVATGLSQVEEDSDTWRKKFENVLSSKELVPAGRVLYGAGSGEEVTYFNCYVLPSPQDSRGGLAEHRNKAAEIMARGGGVGTNGSSIRPKNALARGVNGKSSGSVSWLNDLSSLTNLIEQGGSRRGAQMLILSDWHPDIIEFIISKMQNPKILRFIVENFEDEEIVGLAKEKLNFKAYTPKQLDLLKKIAQYENAPGQGGFTAEEIADTKQKIADGGEWGVNNIDYLSGANISVAITNDFMEAVKNEAEWGLRYPDTNNYNEEQMKAYDEKWHEVVDVRDWEAMGYPIATHRTIPAKELWDLITFCATYSAEPGIMFIDRANEMAMSNVYGQKVIATNP